MKKILALLLVVAILCSFAACVANPDTSSTTENPSSSSTADNTPGETTAAPTEPDETKPSDPWTAYETITIEKAQELCGESGNVTEERYYIIATISSVTNAAYGAMTIEDETGSISVYGTYSEDGSIGYADMAEKPYKGDTVLLHCILQNFNGTKEIKNARLIAFKHSEVEIDESSYTEMTIKAAREAEDDTLVKVSGVVARITYANGMKPSGFILVDNTQSIYVYDADVAQRVKIGNTVTVLAHRTTWILDTELTNANKFGYKGCTQLDEATLKENDEKTDGKFDTSWITETTVKEIMDNPVSNDITSTIYKVNALITREDGNGFINYYIDDLDGTTGSYTYTQCNGSDFSWLDEFDGKICTVYLCPLNCKSAASGCTYRFLPVAVEDNNFKFDTKNAAEFAVKYYGVTQFLNFYGGDPAQDLQTSVSSALLGFENATLSYASSDTSIITVDNGELHCLATGTAKITVTGKYGDVTYSQDVEIEVKIAEQIEAGTVKDAIAADLETTVTIRGIIAGSLVNKDGFYIIDSTGIIAVLTDTDTLATLKLGYEVVVEGVRAFDGKTADSTWCTTCVKDAKVLANYYGKHEYDTTNFITGKTLADFNALNVDEDHTTEVYVLKATIEYVETTYYSLYTLKSGDTSVNLYCSSGKQYSFLKPYIGQEVTLELVPCNWSSKSNYPGCVLSITTADGTKIVNNCNFG